MQEASSLEEIKGQEPADRLRAQAGIRFDPELLEIFLEMF